MNDTKETTADYAAFLERKTHLGNQSGFEPLFMPDFLFPFQRAKGLAVACWRVRDKWCEQAYDFWLSQYASTGEAETHEIVNKMHDLWMTVRAKVRELEGAGAVGGSWLVEATHEQLKAQSPIQVLCEPETSDKTEI